MNKPVERRQLKSVTISEVGLNIEPKPPLHQRIRRHAGPAGDGPVFITCPVPKIPPVASASKNRSTPNKFIVKTPLENNIPYANVAYRSRLAQLDYANTITRRGDEMRRDFKQSMLDRKQECDMEHRRRERERHEQQRETWKKFLLKDMSKRSLPGNDINKKGPVQLAKSDTAKSEDPSVSQQLVEVKALKEGEFNMQFDENLDIGSDSNDSDALTDPDSESVDQIKQKPEQYSTTKPAAGEENDSHEEKEVEPANERNSSHSDSDTETEVEIKPNLKSKSKSKGQKNVIKDGHYFLALQKKETDRLMNLAKRATNYVAQIENLPRCHDEALGLLRSAAGQARLLCSKKLSQFGTLCRYNISKDTKNLTSCEDLQGYWDLVHIEIARIDTMFRDIEAIRANNWLKGAKVGPPRKTLKSKVPKDVKPKVLCRPETILAAAALERERRLEEYRRNKESQIETIRASCSADRTIRNYTNRSQLTVRPVASLPTQSTLRQLDPRPSPARPPILRKSTNRVVRPSAAKPSSRT